MASAYALLSPLSSAFALTDGDAALMAEAAVSQAQARSIALAKVPRGVVKSTELEREQGRLVWSFDIAQPKVRGVTEILIDAKTGVIVSVKRETALQEAQEARADAKAK